MRHHVAAIGARGLIQYTGFLRATPTRSLTQASRASFVQRRASSLATRACVHDIRAWRHGSPDHASVAWTEQTAPVSTRLGLRRAFSSTQGLFPRPIHTATWTVAKTQRRWKSDLPAQGKDALKSDTRQAAEGSASSGKQPPDSSSSNYHLLDRLPHLHRPTKEELLSAATGFWHRLQIRFKWLTIRSARPFNSEEIFAFLSWIFWGHVLWIVVGTTTFVSLAIWAINTVFAQETLAGWVGNYLTKSSGVTIVFENAIVPTWRDGVITFNNVFLSRRPGQGRDKRARSVSKGSSTTAAAAAAEAMNLSKDATSTNASDADPEDDGNYTQFDVTIRTVDVTLSFTKWFNGHGLLSSVSVHGVRGMLDRTHVQSPSPDEPLPDPKSYRHEHHIGDFEIDGFKMEDVLLTVHQPGGFRPFTVSVFNCELPRLRKQWLFYDFLSANNMSGSFDNSLFTIHPRQVHGITGMALGSAEQSSQMLHGDVEDAGQWKKHSRLRIDGLKIDHLNRGVEGPFSWIQEGNVDIVADVMIPNDEDGSIAKVMSDFYDRMEATVTQNTGMGYAEAKRSWAADNVIRHSVDEGSGEYQSDRQAAPKQSAVQTSAEEDNRFLIMDLRVQLNDVRASVPLFPKEFSYINTALIHPITSYINSRHTFIPINCRIVKRQSEFDGSWTIFDSGLLDDLSREVYEAFVRDIYDQRQQRRRMKKVGGWVVKVAAQALFLGLAGQLA
ncbi:mitochondrion biogenesis protein [Hortaea werneckii]|nr:mitochondrion biogenesis protein [Hortaea werneckii]KAI7092579.1 mitochondrion biogenesis protein [Hortaea werneckii]KAI7230980.1 mitochondrion biogenesis protein [Hortaea werneckii]KAI7302966.1 mitochondrion biogenesis protein [Hortaea werneckii]KAI7389928.1 mitochondrion biogenesis protein [Hortaea werneckii]